MSPLRAVRVNPGESIDLARGLLAHAGQSNLFEVSLEEK
jgi:hypothetical protein